MSITTALLSFSIAAALLTLTPGLDTALVMRTAIVEGRRTAFLAALGVSMGVLSWGVIASLGLGAVSASLPDLHAGIQIAGALYLVWQGAAMLRSAARIPQTGGAVEMQPTGGSWFLKGLLTNLLNPKVGLFYISFLPQFTPSAVNPAAFGVLLAAIHVAMGIAWFAVIILFTASLATRLSTPGVRRTLDGLTGSALVILGMKLLFSRTA